MGDRHLSSWPPSAPRELETPRTSLWSNLDASTKRRPERRAIVFYDSTLTYSQLHDEVERMAGYLQTVCGVKRGDRVGIYMQNSPQWVIAYYAILRANAAVVPINPMNLTNEVRYMLEDSGTTVLFAAQELAQQVLPLVSGKPLQHLIMAAYSDYVTTPTDLAIPDFIKAPRASFDAPGVIQWSAALAQKHTPGPLTAGPDDLCVIPYTSGTTGNPKGCIHPHSSVMHTAVGSTVWSGTSDDECILAVLPFFHVTGMQNSMNSSIYTGATVAILPRWDRKVAAELIQRYRVTGWTAVPTMVVDLLSSPDIERYDLSSIKMMGGGGAAMPEAIAQKLQDLCGLTYIEGYGLSETIAPTHINPPQRAKKQCLGIPIFGTDSRVVNPDTLEELGPNEVGEIITHGPQVFRGYWNKPEANQQCFVELDGKRFFRTGDLGRVDEDGYFFIVDRLKRMINAAGFKVWPAEVEAILYAHPAVQEAAIIGTKDPRRGESVKAVVVVKAGKRDEIDEESFIRWCQANMAAYKVPRSVEFVDSLPKTGSGKIMWRALQEKENERLAAAAS